MIKITPLNLAMNSVRMDRRCHSIGVSMLIAAVIAGCVAAPAPVVITDAEQAARLVFTCPNARTVEVTRTQAGRLAIVVVDGRTLQLPRVVNAPSERYSNRTHTLNIFGGSATFESLGHGMYGPCTSSADSTYGPAPRSRPRRENVD